MSAVATPLQSSKPKKLSLDPSNSAQSPQRKKIKTDTYLHLSSEARDAEIKIIGNIAQELSYNQPDAFQCISSDPSSLGLKTFCAYLGNKLLTEPFPELHEEQMKLPKNVTITPEFAETRGDESHMVMKVMNQVGSSGNCPLHVLHLTRVIEDCINFFFHFKKADDSKWTACIYASLLLKCAEYKETCRSPEQLNFESIADALNSIFLGLNTSAVECYQQFWNFSVIFEALGKQMTNLKLNECLLLPKGKFRFFKLLCQTMASKSVNFPIPEETLKQEKNCEIICSVLKFVKDSLQQIEQMPLELMYCTQKASELDWMWIELLARLTIIKEECSHNFWQLSDPK